MKKSIALIVFVLALFTLVGCKASSVKVEIKTVTPARTSIYFELNITDPKKEIAENGLTAVLYYEGNELTRKAPVTKDELTSVQFDGLSVGYKYDITIFATYGGKSHKMATTTTTTTLVGGTVENPKLIKTVEDFNAIKNDLSAFYRLENDLDFNNLSFQNTYGTNAFNGKFDGNNHAIKNVKMNLITSYVGLFGYNKGTIKNLTIENVELNFTTATQNVGILAGKNAGTIENVTLKNSSVKTAYARTGQIFIGGLVGLSESSSKLTNVTVENVQLDLNVTGRTEPYVGLVAGRTQGTQLTGLSATGGIKVLSADSTYVGGLVGAIENVGTIISKLSDSKATSTIEVSIDVLTTLTNDTGMSIYVGGLLGASLGSDVSNVFADATITLPKVSNTSANNRNDDELAIGALIGFTTAVINEALATGSIVIGLEAEDTIVSFEKLYVGGIAGFQQADRIKKALAYAVDITVFPGKNMTLYAANPVGNEITTGTKHYGGSLKVKDGSYTSQIHISYVDGIQTEFDSSATIAVQTSVLDTYFTSAFVKALLTGIRA